MANAQIGDRSSALRRMQSFVENVTAYLGHRPSVVVLFAEDYDAIGAHDVGQLEKRERLRIECGPSIAEYSSPQAPNR